MATAAYTAKNYQLNHSQTDAKASLVKSPRLVEVTFVPELPDFQRPVRKAVRAFEWRRQLSDYLASVVSGAVSLR